MKTFTRIVLFMFSFLCISTVFATKSIRKSRFKGFSSNAPNGALVRLKVNLFDTPDNPSSLSDGNTVVFDNAYSDAVDGDDAVKLTNPGENFGIERDGIALAIEARQPVTNTDTIYYDMWHMHQQDYQIEFIPENLDNIGMSALLIDKFLGTTVPLSLSTATYVNFTVNSLPASSQPNRFEVIFINASGPLPVTFTGITATHSEAGIAVNWKVAAEDDITQYNIERSADGLNFTQIGSVAAKLNNGQVASYNWLDANPVTGTGYYRVKGLGKSGIVTYSTIVQETVGNAKASISVYPNPVAAGQINLVLTKLPSGVYKIRVLNLSGQEVYAATLNHTAGINEKLNIEGIISMGTYRLEAIAPGKEVYTTGIFIK